MPKHPTKDESFLKYMNSLKKYSVMTKEEEYKVAKLFIETGKAEYAHRLVTANLRFVAKLVYEYANTGHEMMDLIQEGNEGLMIAVRKFEPDRGYKLISYAVWWIKAMIKRYIMNNHSQVKVGTTQAQRKLFFSLRSERAKLLQERNGGEVTNEDMARVLDCQPHEIEEMEMRLAGRDFSLQTPMQDDTPTPFQDHLVEPGEDQSELVERALLARRVTQILNTLDLNPKEKYIIENRLMSQDPITLQVIGDRFNVSRERIRQIESNLKKKIRAAIEKEDEGVLGNSSERTPSINDIDSSEPAAGLPTAQTA